jgi:hypothetical protein
MMKVRQEYEMHYQELYERFSKVVYDFIEQNPSPDHSFQQEMDTLKHKYGNFPYRFRYIVQKYYLNVTLELRRIPRLQYVCTIGQFILHKKYDRRYKKWVDYYLSLFKKELDSFRGKFPQCIIDEEFVSQIIKVIYACLLSTYIRQPVFRRRHHWKQLDDAFYYGFYIAMLYLLTDDFLDDEKIGNQLKDQFHHSGLDFLAGNLNQEIPDDYIYKASEHVVLRMVEKFPFEKNELLYRHLFCLQKAQFDDMRCEFEAESFESLKVKTTRLGLKTFLSYVIMLPQWARGGVVFSNDAFLFSLYTQLDDDMRDAIDDRRNNVRTFYSFPLHAKPFNPYIFALRLIDKFVSKNKDLSWMYADLLKHAHREEHSESMDKEKIRVFIRKVVEKDLSEIMHYVNS